MCWARGRFLRGTMTPGDFRHFTHCSSAMLIAPVAQIVAIGPQITEALAGLERTREVLNEKPEDRDPARTVRLDARGGPHWLSRMWAFAYDAGKQVLYDVSFQSEPGTVTALVGPSGAGKSTIIGLIAAFLRADEPGACSWTAWICRKCASIPTARNWAWCCRKRFLFDGTIRENVAFARPDASEKEILAACRIARVDEFAETFEKKYDTIVGERGVKLSGGQKQRVSIARAILADPRILILDEATSSLDSESEALIQEGLALSDARPDHVRDRAPPLDDSARRSDPGGGGADESSSAERTNRCMPQAAATTTSTPSSTASRRISFWLREKWRPTSRSRRRPAAKARKMDKRTAGCPRRFACCADRSPELFSSQAAHVLNATTAFTTRSTSSSVVCQPDTLTRIARHPRQVVAPKKASPLALIAAITWLVRRS